RRDRPQAFDHRTHEIGHELRPPEGDAEGHAAHCREEEADQDALEARQRVAGERAVLDQVPARHRELGRRRKQVYVDEPGAREELPAGEHGQEPERTAQRRRGHVVSSGGMPSRGGPRSWSATRGEVVKATAHARGGRMRFLAALLLDGALAGAIYALVALAFVVVYKA